MPEKSDAEKQIQYDKAVAEVKDLRKKIDAVIQLSRKLNGVGDDPSQRYNPKSRALSLVTTNLEQGKMWAGKRLEELGSPFPAELADRAEETNENETVD